LECTVRPDDLAFIVHPPSRLRLDRANLKMLGEESGFSF
jgi:hypothetical protein